MSKRMNKERARENLEEKNITCREYLKLYGLNEKSIYDTPYGLEFPITKDFIEYVKVIKKDSEDILTRAFKTFIDSEWVDVRDRLPSEKECKENCEQFLITDSSNSVDRAYYDIEDNSWHTEYSYNEDVIAWKPLPKPYEREE